MGPSSTTLGPGPRLCEQPRADQAAPKAAPNLWAISGRTTLTMRAASKNYGFDASILTPRHEHNKSV